ncbi:MAG: aminotransferase class I/II-fold pyridoxal phosphate-dependent enzyme [Proteobacteria bacterium]|nr:aminotransferase class I/II-fold pyridoxal phosphate-dependent enzyme [Pseudomonadota bacterium]
MKFSQRLTLLGTETAFAVSALAEDWRARGNKIYPFHLGDINIQPPEALIEGVSAAIRNGKNGYCPGAGIPLFREQLAAHFSAPRGVSYAAENVAVQPGGKPVITKFIQAVMNPGEEVLYPVPGFPIYESQIRYYGGVAVPYYYHATDDGFRLDIEAISQAVNKNTRAIIFNNYHNPTGAMASAAELDAIAKIAVEHDLWILNDDAYYAIRYDDTPAQSLLTRPGVMERTINLFTFSKQFAMTGWRIGAAIGPVEAINNIAKMNTNIESCTTHFIQQAIGQALADDTADYTPILAELKCRRDALVTNIAAIDGIDVSVPQSAFYLYCDLKRIMQRKKITTIEPLMTGTLQQTGVSFCTGAHFGAGSDTTFARFAFSGISVEDINAGGVRLKQYFESEQ